MKLYLFDTINRYKRYSETLDVKTKICNRPWIVFNDGGEKEVYKFKEDGTINIVLSGRVTRGTWEYDPTDKTIIISASDQSYMVHPGMYDDMLLALQVDGTNECSFLIEENNSKDFAPKTYSDLMLFFEEKEKKSLEEEERIRLLKEEEEKARIKAEEEAELKRIEEEKRRALREEEDDRIIADFRLFLRENHYKSHGCLYIYGLYFLFLIFVVLLGMGFFYCLAYLLNVIFHVDIGLSVLLAMVFSVYLMRVVFKYGEKSFGNHFFCFDSLLKEFVNLPQYKDKIDDSLYCRLENQNLIY